MLLWVLAVFVEPVHNAQGCPSSCSCSCCLVLLIALALVVKRTTAEDGSYLFVEFHTARRGYPIVLTSIQIFPAQPFNVTSIQIFMTFNFEMRFFVASVWSPSCTGTKIASQKPHTARNKTGSAVFSSHSKAFST